MHRQKPPTTQWAHLSPLERLTSPEHQDLMETVRLVPLVSQCKYQAQNNQERPSQLLRLVLQSPPKLALPADRQNEILYF